MKCTVSVTYSCQLRYDSKGSRGMQPAPPCNRELKELNRKKTKNKKKQKNVKKKMKKNIIYRSKKLYDCIDQIGEK